MLSSSSIVLLGNFNPAIFHPEWFDRYKVLPIQETQWAEGEKPKRIEIPYKGTNVVIEEVPTFFVSPNRVYLQFPSLTIDVTLDRYICSSIKSEDLHLLKDVTVKMFNILEHTPVKSVGTNFGGHWKYKDDAQKILRGLFAKKDESFKKVFGDDYSIGGVIAFQQKDRIVTLKISRSTFLEEGISFSINYHNDVIEPHQAKLAVDVIRTNFEEDRKNSIKFVKELLGEPEEIWKPQS